ncbi:MAG: hypothetical protein ACLFQK_00810 [Fibrobacterota bacterium]
MYKKVLTVLFSAAFIISAEKNLPGFSPECKVFSAYYLDISGTEQNSSFSDRANGFEISRIYAGGKYQISDNIKARILTDVSREEKTGKLETYAKYTYAEFNAQKIKSSVCTGLQGTGLWKTPEKFWGLRIIKHAPAESFGKYLKSVKNVFENAPAEENISESLADAQKSGFDKASAYNTGSSADIGLKLKTKFSPGFSMNTMIRNGTGYKEKEDDFYKNIILNPVLKTAGKKLLFSAVLEAEPFRSPDGETRINVFYDLFCGYTSGISKTGINFGSKVFSAPEENITAFYVSLMENLSLSESASAFLRLDYYNTGFSSSSVLDLSDTETDAFLYIGGLEYKLHKKVSLIPNIQYLDKSSAEEKDSAELYVHLQFKY